MQCVESIYILHLNWHVDLAGRCYRHTDGLAGNCGDFEAAIWRC